MANCYVKAYYDWIEQTAALSDAERGRLFIAVLQYARNGTLPDSGGRESILFPAFKSQIDRDNKISSSRSASGKAGFQAKLSKLKQTQANVSKNANKDKDKEEDKEKENNIYKHKYGEFKHVLLSDAEFEKIKRDFPDYENKIRNLDEYLENHKSKHYDSHYLTIRTWARKEKSEEPSNTQKTYDVNEIDALLKNSL